MISLIVSPAWPRQGDRDEKGILLSVDMVHTQKKEKQMTPTILSFNVFLINSEIIWDSAYPAVEQHHFNFGGMRTLYYFKIDSFRYIV